MAFVRNIAAEAARSIGTLLVSALVLSLGLLAAPTAAQAGETAFCAPTIVAFGATLCSSSATPGNEGSTTFNYNFAGGGGGDTNHTQAFIPLLDANAITAGSFKINGFTVTPVILTGADVTAGWGTPSFGGSKSVFDVPAALIGITLSGGVVTDVSFSSNDPVVSGPIRVGETFDDPPLPGKVPEPGTLALFGSALAGLGIYRHRRKVA